MSVLTRLAPPSLQGYQTSWLSRDVVAGVTLAAVAIPECMGYTSISQTPVVTGLYSIIFPTIVFALLGSSRLLVVGADSATAAILAAGLASLGIAGLTPNSAEWVAWSSLVALVCAGLLIMARLFRLGFLGDFLSASVLIGFLTGVGIQVFAGQIPDMLGIPKGQGNWFEQQWWMITHVGQASGWTVAFALGTLGTILGFKRWLPKVPGAVVAVILSIILSGILDASSHGVAVIGSVQGGFPPIGLPDGIDWGDVPKVLGIAFACFVLIVAQSAATSRSFAMKHAQRVDVNRDLVGLSGGNVAAALTGTFVVNGSPTKTQILDEQRGRTQVANVTMSLVVLAVVLWFTGLLTDMPKAVLAAIVFLIGVGLIDGKGFQRIRAVRTSEFLIAAVTAVVVFAVGVEQGIVLAVVLSILEIIRRSYSPQDFLVGVDSGGSRTYTPAQPGHESLPGLLVFRFDAPLFYANANRFADTVQGLLSAAPTPVRWLVLDCSSMVDVDYSASLTLAGLIDAVHSQGRVFAVAAADPQLLATLEKYGTLTDFDNAHIYSTVQAAVADFRSSPEGHAPAQA